MQKYSIRNNKISEDVVKELSIYPELLRQLLFSRGIESREDAERFLNPDYYRDTHNPFLMKDMEKSVKRILKAISSSEKILIYSDYDADGIPGAVIFHDFFKKIGYQNFENYIPHRHNEGYGLNIKAIKKFKEDGVNLIITIDCGIKDLNEIKEAQKNGIDVIVTDHHLEGVQHPQAFAILNPKQEDCNYPDDQIAGAGVVFKLIQALISEITNGCRSPHGAKRSGECDTLRVISEIPKGWEKWLLDMVGLATISDMVPLKNENRTFSYFGMKVLRKSPRYGLIHLLRKLRMDQKNLTEDDLAFMITPRINVASRIDDPIKAFELLSSDDEVIAGELAGYLDKINSKRKTLVTTIIRQANKKLKERNETDVIVVGSPDWNVGVVGLVASSLVGKYGKTSFVWGRDGKGEFKGSCRSCGAVNVVDLMNKAGENIFINIGGHKMAGGFSILNDQIHFLEDKLNNAYQKIEKGEKNNKIVVDKKITLENVNWENYKLIEKLAPFGVENEKPVFLIEDIEIFNVKIFGKQNNHLGLDFRNSKGQNISSIQFFADNIEDGETKFERGQKVSMIVNIEKSTFRNVNELRLKIITFV